MINIEVSTYIESAEEIHKEILIALRQLIFSIVKDVDEQFKWNRPVYAVEKDFCYLKTTKKHVTLGFFEFDKITTNKDIIEGTGKSMRHIKLSKLKDITDLKLKTIIEEVLK
ncbi:DUF1801 domain-containing protein [Cognaticolwellia mytili]|uniref:DUF1801 domain-containing protein n=1 Tax=Cognaticolwellia mytili TaxID=1888913 RepID=UPI001B805DA9|nr:DUF1801 domain-containing protein [Cognaticolwellia mytili]